MVTVSAYSDPVIFQLAPGDWRFYAVPFAFVDGTYGLLEYNEVYDWAQHASHLASINLNLIDTINGQFSAEVPMPLNGLVSVLLQMPGGRFLQSGHVNATTTTPAQTFLQFLTPDGVPDGQRLIIDPPEVTYIGGIDSAVLLPNGGFIATWTQYDGANPNNGWDVAYQIFSANGRAKSAILTLGAYGGQSEPDVAVLSPTRFVETWLDTSSSWAIRAQVFDLSGAAVSAVTTVASGFGTHANYSKVVALANGGFAAFWGVQDFDPDANLTSYQMRIYAADGTAVSAEVTVDSLLVGPDAMGYLSTPEIIALRDGRIAVAWSEHIGAGPNDTGRTFYSQFMLQIFEADGTVASPVYTLGQSDGLQGGTGIVALADGRIAASWMQENPVTHQMEQVTQILDPRDMGINLTGSVLGDQNVGSTFEDTMRGGLGDDTLFGNSGDDLLSGGVGNDLLLGGYGHDKLLGSDGRDYLSGFDGNDRLIGGTGSDLAVGGRGRDVFVFAPGDGADKVKGFADGQDRIDLSAYEFLRVGLALRHFAAVTGGVEFSDGADTIRIMGLTMDQLTGADLILI